jgi:glycosyltransferase involved in cell wall biosynthesis
MTCKNRSLVKVNGEELRLLPNCIDSIVKYHESINDDIEIIISDWESDDWPLKDWVPQKLEGKIPYKIVDVVGEGFRRGRGRNLAFNAAEGDNLFFVDADMLFESDYVFNAGLEALASGMAAFPICFSYTDSSHVDGWWRHQGFGNVMVKREHLLAVGSWWEREVWGQEDTQLNAKLARMVPIWRENAAGFFHQWHPNDHVWKKKYDGK